MLGAFASIGGFIVKEIAGWVRRRDEIKAAELEAKVATIRAKADLAAYQLKADLEWDLKWAEQADRSWKDELVLVMWSIPMIGLFVPGLRPHIMEGFEYLKAFNPEAPSWYIAGWAVIFSAVFGMKAAMQFMLPSRYATLVNSLSSAPPDIPYEVVDEIQRRINTETRF